MLTKAERRKESGRVVKAYAEKEALDISDKCTPIECARMHAHLLRKAGCEDVSIIEPNNHTAIVEGYEIDANLMFTGRRVRTSWLGRITPQRSRTLIKTLIARLDGKKATRPDDLANIQVSELAASILRFSLDDAEKHIQDANIKAYQNIKSNKDDVPIIGADREAPGPNPWKNWATIDGAKAQIRMRIASGRLHIEISFNEGRDAWLKSDVVNIRQSFPDSIMASLVGRPLNSLVDFSSVESQKAAESAAITAAFSPIPLLTSLTYESPAGNLSKLLKAA